MKKIFFTISILSLLTFCVFFFNQRNIKAEVVSVSSLFTDANLANEVAKRAGVTLDEEVTQTQLDKVTYLPVANVSDLSGIENLKKLTRLSLTTGTFATVPVGFEDLALTELTLNSPNLTVYPEALYNMTSLKILNLTSNSFEIIPSEIGNLTNLTSLMLNNAKAYELPDVFTNLDKLTILGISNSNISSLPASLINAPLATFYGVNAKFVEYPSIFNDMSTLKSINLTDNQISEIPSNLPNVTYFSANNNLINPNHILTIANNKEVYFTFNQLSIVVTKAKIAYSSKEDLLNYDYSSVVSLNKPITLNSKYVLEANKYTDAKGKIIDINGYFDNNYIIGDINVYFGITGSDITSSSVTPITFVFSKKISEYFPDPVLAQTIATNLKLNIDDVVTQSQLASISNIHVDKVTDLTGIKYLTNLTTLTIDGSLQTAISEEIAHLTNLNNLVLQNFPDTTLPSFIYNLDRITRLGLNGTAITQLSEDINKLTKLEHLSITRTAITEIPAYLSNNKLLTRLEMGDLGIDQLPESFKDLELNYLYLTGNKFTSIPEEILNMQTLTFLYLNKNMIKELNVGELNTPYLINLGLSDNQIEKITGSFSNLQIIESINISDNNLTDIDGVFAELNTLESLYLKNNQIISLPNDLALLDNLLMINVNNNLLDSNATIELKNFSFNIADYPQDSIIFKDDYSYTIDDITDLDNINYVDLIKLTSGRELSNNHKYEYEFVKDGEVIDIMEHFNNKLPILNENINVRVSALNKDGLSRFNEVTSNNATTSTFLTLALIAPTNTVVNPPVVTNPSVNNNIVTTGNGILGIALIVVFSASGLTLIARFNKKRFN